MLFKDLFKDILEKEIPDDLAIYFKKQVEADLDEFIGIKDFVEELETLVNDKDR